MKEKLYFENSKGLKLAADLHLPKKKTDSIVIISHGFTSSKDRDRFVKLSEALVKEGIVAFRFDFGGCGESEEREISVRKQVDDLKSAIEFLKNKGYINIVLMGESLGGLTSILSYNEDIKTLVLSAPVSDYRDKSQMKDELGLEIGDRDYMIFEKDGRRYRIPKDFFREMKSINQKEILSKISCPVLIMHGDNDDTISLEKSRSALKFLPNGSNLEIISGGVHSLKYKVEQVIPLCVNWIKKFV